MVVSCKTVVQYYNCNISTETIHPSWSDFLSLPCTSVYAWVLNSIQLALQFYHVVGFTYPLHSHSQGAERFHHHTDPSTCPFKTTLPSPPFYPVSSLSSLTFIFHFYNFVILRMLYKWNQTYTSFGIGFPSLSISLWSSIQVVAHVSNAFFWYRLTHFV
jgi:hypothetical protein